MNRIYVSDTNIWIDFRNAGLLNELFQLPLTLCCTEFVLEELTDFDHEALKRLGLLIEVLDEAAVLRLLVLQAAHHNSAFADVSCYLLAQERQRPLLTGDGRLRKQALHDGLEVHGALWLLDQLLIHEVIEPQRAALGLEHMLSRNARLPQTECQARLSRWKT